jgi:hypothetical protein
VADARAEYCHPVQLDFTMTRRPNSAPSARQIVTVAPDMAQLNCVPFLDCRAT